MVAPSALTAGAGYLSRREAVLTNCPLLAARLWHQEPPRTSQRRVLQGLGDLVTLVCGGNRTGKTSLAAQLAVAVALGRDDPVAAAWLRYNHLPPAILPSHPGDVWACALDSGDSLEYVRPAVARYLPAGSTWRNRDGNGPASVKLPGGGRIGFKSVDEGRDGYQGTAKDLIWFDEEPRDRGVVDEAMARLIDRRGRMLLTMTPLLGLTWVYDRWVAEQPEGVALHTLHGADNPYLPRGALERILRQYGAHERASRERGEWVALEGRVYTFDRAVHVVPSRPVPAEWPRYGAIDFGTRNPFAYLHCAVDPAGDTLHVLAEHYRAETLLSDHARAIKALWAALGRPRLVVADPEDKGARLTLAREHCIATIVANKEIRAGINAVAERLAPDVAGHPHLLIHAGCRSLVREFENYVWADTATKDAPRKEGDHALDALRYLCRHLSRGGIVAG